MTCTRARGRGCPDHHHPPLLHRSPHEPGPRLPSRPPARSLTSRPPACVYVRSMVAYKRICQYPTKASWNGHSVFIWHGQTIVRGPHAGHLLEVGGDATPGDRHTIYSETIASWIFRGCLDINERWLHCVSLSLFIAWVWLEWLLW